jgi:hypothetical protein
MQNACWGTTRPCRPQVARPRIRLPDRWGSRQAERYYERTLEVLKKRRQWREASAVAREWGRLLREEGRQAEALDLMEQATLLGIRDYARSLRTREAR